MRIRSMRWPIHRRIVLAFAAVAALTLGVTANPAAASEEVGSEFRDIYTESGGTMIFGRALSPRVSEDGRIAQYFERQRLELHDENPAPYNILLGRLGAEEAERRGLQDAPAFAPVGNAGADCTYFEETGHQTCGAFQQHWKGNGVSLGDAGVTERESLALFGYPISEEFTDPETGLTTQYFERARFEYHPENAGTEHEVLLGHIGTPIWNAQQGNVEPAPAPEPEPEPQVQAEPEPEPQVETVAQETSTGGATGTFIAPANGLRTQPFGAYGGHRGMDIANDMHTPVKAADGGTVVESGWASGYGYNVVIDHGNGYQTRYAHLAQQPPVGVGQQVSQGQVIGPMGSTGNSTGPHVHFEIMLNGQLQNPAAFV